MQTTDASGSLGTAPVDPFTYANAGQPAGKREVDLYVRTYSTLLRSSGPVDVDALIPAHLNIQSSLHAQAASDRPDMGAFMYSTLRLPPEIVTVRNILLGQAHTVFAVHGYTDLDDWTSVSAPGRRRKWQWDGRSTMAVMVGSASDLDDLIPTIVGWQIEWNKMHQRISETPELAALIEAGSRRPGQPGDADGGQRLEQIGEGLGIEPADWARLCSTWGRELWPNLRRLAARKRDLRLQMLGGTYLGYTRSAQRWWAPAGRSLSELDLGGRPVYFISSNTHSLANILTGTARRRRDELVRFVEESAHPDLLPELRKLQAGEVRASWDNFLYYTARLYYTVNPEARAERDAEEAELGVVTIDPTSAVDVGIQIMDLGKIDPNDLDPRIRGYCPGGTDAVIVNINYPLGLAAYHIFGQIATGVDRLRGIYILGKAATLNARIGDVMIANDVYDEHSGNTYWFANCFSSADLDPFLVYGSTLDRQRAVTVKGTYLQNRGYLDFYYRESFTVVEMEAGPYLSALYEDVALTRHPTNESVNMSQLPVDLGIIHYASDTPYSHAHTLGARGLSYYGMDSTYAATLAIVRRVFEDCRKA